MKKILMFLGLFVLLIVSVSANLNSNIQGYWALNSSSGTTAIDSTGNGNDGTLFNTPTWNDGKIGNALSFLNTSTEYVNISHALFNSATQSISMWIKPTQTLSSANGDNEYFFGTHFGGGDGYVMTVSGTDVTNRLQFYAGGTLILGIPVADPNLPSWFVKDQWTHLVLTINSSGNNTLYVNGGTYNYSSTTAWTPFDSKYLILGATGDLDANFYLNGTIDEFGMWNSILSYNDVVTDYNSSDGATYPFPSGSLLNTPIDNYNSSNQTINFNGTIQDVVGTLDNVSLIIDGLYNQTNSSGITGDYIFTASLGLGSHNWTYEYCDDGGCANLTARNLTIAYFSVNDVSYNSTSYETSQEVFTINISTLEDAVPASPLFWYNGSSYVANITNGDNYYILSKEVTIPLVNSSPVNMSFNFTFTISSNAQSTQDYEQNVTAINLTICQSAPQNIPYANFTFKDESTLTSINATIPTSTLEYWLGDGSITKTLTYSNLTANDYYAFCFSPSNKDAEIDINMQYASSGYPQRIYNPIATNFSNSSTDTTLYLLSSADGLFVTFQVVTQAQTGLDGVAVSATRVLDGSVTEVGTGTTDSAGLVTFWLNPDFEHTFTFIKSGYDTFTTTLFPTQSSYTIVLGGGTTNVTDYYRGVLVYIQPTEDFFDNHTIQNFSMIITSSYWDLDGFGFSIYYGNGTLIGTQSSSDNGGSLYISGINVTGDSVYARYYFIVNGTTIYSYSARSWIIQSTEGREFSILHFFDDLTTYITGGSGLFGMDNFGRILLSFIFIVMVVGGISYNYGLRSEGAIMGILFGVVFFLDVGLGFIPRIQFGDVVAIPYLPTFITFLILMAVLFKEARN